VCEREFWLEFLFLVSLGGGGMVGDGRGGEWEVGSGELIGGWYGVGSGRWGMGD